MVDKPILNHSKSITDLKHSRARLTSPSSLGIFDSHRYLLSNRSTNAGIYERADDHSPTKSRTREWRKARDRVDYWQWSAGCLSEGISPGPGEQDRNIRKPRALSRRVRK